MTVLERDDRRLDEISRRADEIRVGRAVAVLFASLFFSIGWLCGKLVNGIALVLSKLSYGVRWVLAAFIEGFEQGRLVSRGSARTG